MGDFSVDMTAGDCRKSVEEHLDSRGFTATSGGSSGSTIVFQEDEEHNQDPSMLKTMLGIASNVLLSSSSGRGEPENSRSVQVVILEEGDGARLVIDASEPDLQQSLDEWVTTNLGGRSRN